MEASAIHIREPNKVIAQCHTAERDVADVLDVKDVDRDITRLVRLGHPIAVQIVDHGDRRGQPKSGVLHELDGRGSRGAHRVSVRRRTSRGADVDQFGSGVQIGLRDVDRPGAR